MIRRHLRFGLIELLTNLLGRFGRPLTLQMGSIPDFNLVVIYPLIMGFKHLPHNDLMILYQSIQMSLLWVLTIRAIPKVEGSTI
jgi:hypothetical protein